MKTQRADAAVVGAGILGLAHAWHLARQGRRVVVFERSPRAAGASIRNFGMVWPVGQAPGEPHAVALRSRELWGEVLEAARIPHYPTGSLHVVYREDEERVAREFAELGPGAGYAVEWQTPEQVMARGGAVEPRGLRGGLWSAGEAVVDPPYTIAALAAYLAERHGVEFHFDTPVTAIALPRVTTPAGVWEVDRAIVCGGDDFATLYPEAFAGSGLTRCKLQMMRTAPQPEGWRLGPSLAGGLTLRFYAAFQICSTLPALRARIAAETPELDAWGIHILVSQTANGAITLGDSHEYGLAVDIFDRTEVDAWMLREIDAFVRVPDRTIAQRWHGVYAKHPSKPWVVADPAPGVTVVTGVGGSGMTLSFGLAERVLAGRGV